MRGSILDIARKWKSRHAIINRASLKEEITGRGADVVNAINTLIDEGWIHELAIPKALRDNPRASLYIIGLTPEERKKYQADGTLPDGSDTPKTEAARATKVIVPDTTEKPTQNAEK